MYPILIGKGFWALPSYFTFLLIAFLVASYIFRRQGENDSYNALQLLDFSIILLIASLLGARLASVLFDGYLMDYIHLCTDPSALAKLLPNGMECTADTQCLKAQNAGHDIGAICSNGMCIPEADCFRALKFWSGGLTYYGGFIAAFLTAIYLTRRWKLSFLKIADLAAPSIAIGLFIARIGCFLGGCCFGAPSELPWAVQFPQHSDAWKHHKEHYPDLLNAQFEHTHIWESLPVHPTQIYESLGALIIFAILWFYFRKRKQYTGLSIAFLLISYAILRFGLEFLRADDRGALYEISTSQWISIPLLIIGILLWIRAKNTTLNTSLTTPSSTATQTSDNQQSQHHTPSNNQQNQDKLND